MACRGGASLWAAQAAKWGETGLLWRAEGQEPGCWALVTTKALGDEEATRWGPQVAPGRCEASSEVGRPC